MKISPITNQYTFKSAPKKQEEVHVFAYDDEISQSRRAKMREDILSKSIPYWEEHDEHALEEKPLELLIRGLTGVKDFLTKPKKEKPIITPNPDDNSHTVQFDPQKPVNSSIYNLDRKVQNISKNKIYRGAMITNQDQFEQLKNANITAIIDLREGSSIHQEDKEGMKVFKFNFLNLDNFSKNPAFLNITNEINKAVYNYGHINSSIKYNDITKIENERFCSIARPTIAELTDFVNLINSENCYMGCDFGTYRTDFAVALNNAINPKTQLRIEENKNKIYAPYLINLLNNLTAEETQKLGITPEFFQEKMDYYKSLLPTKIASIYFTQDNPLEKEKYDIKDTQSTNDLDLFLEKMKDIYNGKILTGPRIKTQEQAEALKGITNTIIAASGGYTGKKDFRVPEINYFDDIIFNKSLLKYASADLNEYIQTQLKKYAGGENAPLSADDVIKIAKNEIGGGRKAFISCLTKFVNLINQNTCYISSKSQNDTDFVILLNNAFNPEVQIDIDEWKNALYAKPFINILNSLDETEKVKLGIHDDRFVQEKINYLKQFEGYFDAMESGTYKMWEFSDVY